MIKYRIIKYKETYQVQKRVFFFFWRTIDAASGTVNLFDPLLYTNGQKPWYNFTTFEKAKQFLDHYKYNQPTKNNFTVIEYYD